jgi:hypothetical protein
MPSLGYHQHAEHRPEKFRRQHGSGSKESSTGTDGEDGSSAAIPFTACNYQVVTISGEQRASSVRAANIDHGIVR